MVESERKAADNPSGRSTVQLISGLVVVAALAVIVVWVMVNRRNAERNNLESLFEELSDRSAEAQLQVVEKSVRNGRIFTKVTWSAADRSTAPSPDKSFEVSGERLRIDTGSVRVQVPKMPELGKLTVYFFERIAGVGGESQRIYDEKGVPDSHRIRGALPDSDDLHKLEQAFWAAVWSGGTVKNMTLERPGGRQVELDLTVGDRFELRLDPQGQVVVEPLKKVMKRLTDFQGDISVTSNDGLSLRIIGREVAVEYAGRIRPDFDNYQLIVELNNQNDAERIIEPSSFVLIDERETEMPNRSEEILTMAPRSTMAAGLRFLVPVGAVDLRLVLRAASDNEGRPLSLNLGPSEVGIGQVLFAGDFAFLIESTELRALEDHFEARVKLIALNRDEDKRELEAKHFVIRAGREEYAAESLSGTEFEADEPTPLEAVIVLGDRLTREDFVLDITETKKRVEQQHARFTLLPGYNVKPGQALRYLNQLAAVGHYESWLKLTSGGRVSFFTSAKERAALSAEHLSRAKALFPDSETIAGAVQP